MPERYSRGAPTTRLGLPNGMLQLVIGNETTSWTSVANRGLSLAGPGDRPQRVAAKSSVIGDQFEGEHAVHQTRR